MLNLGNKDNVLLVKGWRFLVISVLVIGIFLRFTNLDQKVYNADEVRKILWQSGYSSEEFKERVFTGNILSSKELKKYQQPGSEKTVLDAIKVLENYPAHVPLHHLISRFWMQLFGYHPAAKTASIFLFFLSLPCLYWLCIELFNSPLTGWVAIILAVISPFHILSSQNAGAYSLWTVLTLFSSATLLRALRANNKISWLIYAMSLSLGFYTHFFSFIVAIGQGIYVVLIEGLKSTKTLIYYFLATSMSLLAFIPWIVVVLNRLEYVDEGGSYYAQFKVTFSRLVKALYNNNGKVFIDFYHQRGRLESLLHFLVFVLIVYSLYFLVRNANKKVWLFILILIGLTPIVHIIANFIQTSALHIQSRYYLPSHLGTQLTIAYLLASQINSTSIKFWQRRFWSIVFLIIITLGIISGTILMQAREAGLDDQRGTASGQNLAIAPYINQAEKPLVISEATHSFILALLYLVNDDVKFQLLKPQDVKQWQQQLDLVENCRNFSDVFVLYPDRDFSSFIEKNKNVQKQLIVKNLYKITCFPEVTLSGIITTDSKESFLLLKTFW